LKLVSIRHGRIGSGALPAQPPRLLFLCAPFSTSCSCERTDEEHEGIEARRKWKCGPFRSGQLGLACQNDALPAAGYFQSRSVCASACPASLRTTAASCTVDRAADRSSSGARRGFGPELQGCTAPLCTQLSQTRLLLFLQLWSLDLVFCRATVAHHHLETLESGRVLLRTDTSIPRRPRAVID
jgi:hypothetical protein